MEFRTIVKIAENRGLLHHDDAVMLLGSCFSDNIGAKLRGAMIDVNVNPFGTIYNPLSLAALASRIARGTPEAGIDLFMQNGVWNSYAFHSRFSLGDKEAALARMNASVAQAHEHLARCKALVVTLGTAIVYKLASTGQVVNNCHKMPQHNFVRQLAPLHDMVDALAAMLKLLHEYNPSLQVIFTISPIRHIADGLEANSLSKAMLRVAVNETCQAFKDWTEYFPSYEIMMDDLRDYRFYAADMLHPSDLAIEYLWQAFQATYFDDRSAQAIARCERVMKRLQHRPMSHSPEAVARFYADTRSVVRNLMKEYPYLANNKDLQKLLSTIQS